MVKMAKNLTGGNQPVS